jgi:hypothetical protein
MFEQFTSEARDVVARSQDEARRLRLSFSKPAKKVLEHAVHEATRVQSEQLIPRRAA